MTQSLIFFILFIATLIVVIISRSSLLHPLSHGFYRFFAWECILILVVLRLNVWFTDVLAWYQIISWTLLVISIYLVIQSVILLKQIGKQDSQRTDSALYTFEKTTSLVTVGAYRFIRHPLYGSLLLLAWGVFFKKPDWVGCLLASLTTVFLLVTARIEEQENIRYFGEAYRDYIKHTRMFIPFLF